MDMYFTPECSRLSNIFKKNLQQMTIFSEKLLIIDYLVTTFFGFHTAKFSANKKKVCNFDAKKAIIVCDELFSRTTGL